MLAHPGLELVALGSDSLAGSPAGALDPRLNGSLPAFTPNAEAARCGADVLFLCLENAAAAAFEPPPDTVVVDLTGVAPARRRGARARLVRRRRPERGATGCRSSSRRPGP